MVLNTINGVVQNLRQKIANPFLGTFILVWIIDHWEFVYTFFNFDATTTLLVKISSLKVFMDTYDYWDLLYTVWPTIGILVATYTLLTISKFIAVTFEKKITRPLVSLVDSSKYAPIQDYQKLESEIERLETKADQEKDRRLQVESDLERLEGKVKELRNPQSKVENDTYPESKDPEAMAHYISLSKAGLLMEFRDVAIQVITDPKFGLSPSEHIAHFITAELIYNTDILNENKEPTYHLTNIGERVYKLIITNQ